MPATADDRAEHEQRLSAVLVEWLEAADRGQAPDVQALLERYPEFAPALARFQAGQREIESWAAPLRQAAGASTPDPHQTLDAGLAPGECGPFPGDYEPLGELGRGGMGVVYKARHKRLRRLVALKMVRGRQPSAAELQRFRNEAELLACLEHPHVVPIFDVGEEQGQLYFSMKLIEGGSLAEQLPRFRADPRAAARLLLSVAGAVHHAHQRGVLHRDLKPANILLDGDGRPHVTDFGLAKRLASDSELTQSGAIVGTPSYMAPEQASGGKDDCTTVTDVYGLGAILFALLTGRPPFHGATPLDTLVQVRECDPEPPRTSNRLVDRDLEAICLKCLDKDPRRRYRSAELLAEDLDNWLVGEPIHAYPPTRVDRLLRWSRRYRTAVTAAVVVFLVAALGSAGFLWREQHLSEQAYLREKAEREKAVAERQKAEQARDETARQFQRAQVNGTLAWEAANFMYTEVADEWLAHQPYLEEVQRQFLLKALRFFEHFAQENGNDPTVARATANAYRRVGDIHKKLGNHQAAGRAYRQSLALLRKLVEDHPTDPDYRHLWAGSSLNLGGLLHDLGQLDEAEQAFLQAQRTWQQLVEEFPAARRTRFLGHRLGLAAATGNLADVLQARGRTAAAEAAYRQALDLFARLAAEVPTSAVYRHELANCQSSLGLLLQHVGRFPEAEAAYGAALTLVRQLAAEVPHKPGYRHSAAICSNNLGIVLEQTGRFPLAEQSYRDALAWRQKLADDFPRVPKYRDELAHALGNLGVLLQTLGRLPEAEACHLQALTIAKGLAAEFPRQPAHGYSLAVSHNNLGLMLAMANRFEDAQTHYRQALTLYEELLTAFPKRPDFRKATADAHTNLGLLLKTNGKEGAEQEYRQAVKMYHDLLADFPREPAYRSGLAGNLRKKADLSFAKEQYVQAREEYGAARDLFAALVVEFPGAPDLRYGLGGVCHQLAMLCRMQGDLAGARRLFEEAVDHQRVAVAGCPAHPVYRQLLRNHYWELTRTLLFLKEHGPAAEVAEEWPRLFGQQWPDYFWAADVLAYCAGLAEQDSRLSAWDRVLLVQAYGDGAMIQLGQARAGGFSKAQALQTNVDFNSIRSRPDFQQLLGDLEKKSR
jgi:tetratricopeptide (TPR) repeat protein/tRNA A-37 threonylcarbamoyl transferase component Bud32